MEAVQIDPSIFAQINEDMLRNIDTTPTPDVDTVINAADKVFDNSTVYEKLDKLRQEITAETTVQQDSFGLDAQKARAITVEAKPVSNTASTTSTTTSSTTTTSVPINPYTGKPYSSPYPGASTTTTTQTTIKTRDERIMDYTNKLIDAIEKQVTSKVDKEYAKTTEKKSNWTIFDLQEEKIKKEAKMTEKEKIKANKKPLFSDDFKISVYDTIALAGKTMLFTFLKDGRKGGK